MYGLLIVDWEHILDKWGWPTFVLFVVCGGIAWIVKSFVMPQVSAYIERNNRLADEARVALKTQTERLEHQQDTVLVGFTNTLQDFKNVLDASTRRTDKQIDMLAEILTEVKYNGRILSGPRKGD